MTATLFGVVVALAVISTVEAERTPWTESPVPITTLRPHLRTLPIYKNAVDKGLFYPIVIPLNSDAKNGTEYYEKSDRMHRRYDYRNDLKFKSATKSNQSVTGVIERRILDQSKASRTFDSVKFVDEARGKLKKYRKYMLPLLLAYKLKFFTLIPLLMGGLVLLAGSTGLAGFFFALFAATMGLKVSGGHR